MSSMDVFCERCGTRQPADPPRRGSAFSRMLDTVGLTVPPSPQHEPYLRLCFSCRGYSCPRCWNDALGACQTCEPLPDPVVVEQPSVVPVYEAAPAYEPAPEYDAAPDYDAAPSPPEIRPQEPAWPMESTRVLEFGPEPERAAAFERTPEPFDMAEPEHAAAAEVESEPGAEPDHYFAPEPPFEPEPFVFAEFEPTPEPFVVAEAERESVAAAELEPLVVADIEPERVVFAEHEYAPEPVVEVEAEIEPEPYFPAEPEPVVAVEAEMEPEPVLPVEAEVEPEPVAAAEAEPEPFVFTEFEPAPEVEPAPEPVAAAAFEVEPEPEVAPPAPFAPLLPTNPFGPARPVPPPVRPRIEFDVPQPPPAFMLGRELGSPLPPLKVSRSAMDAAASVPQTRLCSQCQLPLSARANFCRRCGSSQSASA